MPEYKTYFLSIVLMVQDSLFQNQKTTVHTNPCCLQCSPNQHTVPALQLAVALTTWCIQAHLWWQHCWSLSLHGDDCRRVSRHQAVDFEKISCTDLSPIIPLPQTTKNPVTLLRGHLFYFFLKTNENKLKSLKVPKPNTKEPFNDNATVWFWKCRSHQSTSIFQREMTTSS